MWLNLKSVFNSFIIIIIFASSVCYIWHPLNLKRDPYGEHSTRGSVTWYLRLIFLVTERVGLDVHHIVIYVRAGKNRVRASHSYCKLNIQHAPSTICILIWCISVSGCLWSHSVLCRCITWYIVAWGSTSLTISTKRDTSDTNLLIYKQKEKENTGLLLSRKGEQVTSTEKAEFPYTFFTSLFSSIIGSQPLWTKIQLGENTNPSSVRGELICDRSLTPTNPWPLTISTHRC